MYTASINTISNQIGTIHFVGLGGIGMSGIAELLHNMGCVVQGSDVAENANIHRLQKFGIKTFIGHAADNINNANVIVKSSAIDDDNIEIKTARANGVPIISRAEMLAEIMRFKISIAVSGTHGKTTTTSLIAALFENANLQPTVVNGGIINSHNTNAYLGNGDYLIAEADESDRSFTSLLSTIAVVTNINPDHLENYEDMDHMYAEYLKFIHNIPFYGFAVLCTDHYMVAKIAENLTDRHYITYGFNSQADIQAFNIRMSKEGSYFDVRIKGQQLIENLFVPLLGEHNVQNSLAAIAIAYKLNLPNIDFQKIFDGFTGVKRRFSFSGEIDGYKIYDDYAHHPVEIAATIKAANQLKECDNIKRIIAVMQPHRYSRLHNLFNEFVDCLQGVDQLIIMPVFEAGEKAIEGYNHFTLAQAVQEKYPNLLVKIAENEDELALAVNELAQLDDLVLCMGAGSITKYANNLVNKIQELTKPKYVKA